MELSQIVFYFIAAFILTMAVLAVTAKQIFRSAIWLLFTLIGIASLYFWMELEFIAAVQVVVYVGGIVVLIIFSIFLTQQSGKDLPRPSGTRKIAALIATLLGAAFTASLVYQAKFEASNAAFDNEVARIGHAMLNTQNEGYALPFEAVSILLLAAMVGAIVIAMRDDKEKQQQTE
ncbi:MAG TPA: NADH-quinone oxidoreductase subunit J [Phnomibacter sp.]|nr:NADH-quinone oxidoreductase subunit J [Phnomibacter sp.]